MTEYPENASDSDEQSTKEEEEAEEVIRDRSYLDVIKGLKKQDIEMEAVPEYANIRELERRVTEREEQIKETIKRERERKEIEDFKSSYKLRRLGLKTNIGLLGIFSIISIAVYIMYVTGVLLYELLTTGFETLKFIYYSVFFVLGIGAFVGGIRLARNVILVEHIFDSAFENEIYNRLEPALREVAKVHVELEDVRERLDKINLNITRTREHPPLSDNPVKSIETAIFTFLRYIVLINVSVAVIIFIFLNPLYSNYILTALFPLWGIVITSEFNLWKTDVAMGWIIAPLGIVPTIIILLDGPLEYSSLVGLIGLGLILYGFSYRAWAKYYVEGKMPFQNPANM